MGQDRASGAAGREYGLKMGRAMASLLGAQRVSPTSNEILLDGRRGVIKACAPANDSFGVTAKMLERLQDIYGALEDDTGAVDVWRLTPDQFRSCMRDSPSAASRGGDAKLIRKRMAVERGHFVRRFSAAEIAVAGD